MLETDGDEAIAASDISNWIVSILQACSATIAGIYVVFVCSRKDGDIDIVSSYSGNLAWIENDGSGQFTNWHTIYSPTSFYSVKKVRMADGATDMDSSQDIGGFG